MWLWEWLKKRVKESDWNDKQRGKIPEKVSEGVEKKENETKKGGDWTFNE